MNACDDTKTVETEMVHELARDLVGLNKLAIRYACGNNEDVQPAQYFESITRGRIKTLSLFFNHTVKRMWIGCQRDLEPQVKEMIEEWHKDRRFGELTYTTHDAQIHCLIFE